VRPVPEAEIIPLEELKWASGSFAAFAAQSQDGFHPRHYSIAGERALQALAVILFAFERTTCLPEQLQWIVSFWLEKIGNRGYRAINLFCSVYRIWVRARRSRMRAWEISHSRNYTAFTAGGGCVSTVYRQALRAETAKSSNQSYVGLFRDLAHFYEQIDRSGLHDRAVNLAVPPEVLFAALAAYRGKRLVTLKGAAVYVGMATKGVPAGCGMATSFVVYFAGNGQDDVQIDSSWGHWT